MGAYYTNIVLLICSFLLITGYILVVLYFTRLYQNVETPYINSNNNVISNKEVSLIVNKMKNYLNIDEFNVNYGKDIKYTNFGKGINWKKKQINIARLPLKSVGYELDYIISRLWYVSKMKNSKRIILPFSIMSNYLMKIILFVIPIIFILQLITFCYGMGFDKGLGITNAGMNVLWKYPIWFIIIIILAFSFAFIWYVLKLEKENIEQQYNKDILSFFDSQFSNYKFDLRSARTYSSRIRLGYNLALNSKRQDRLVHWIGPFLNY